MPLLLQLLGGREIRLEVEAEAWTKAFERALRDNQVVQVEDPEDGGVLGINPRLVLYWKLVPDPEAP
jgi:hypothetical protein